MKGKPPIITIYIPGIGTEAGDKVVVLEFFFLKKFKHFFKVFIDVRERGQRMTNEKKGKFSLYFWE